VSLPPKNLDGLGVAATKTSRSLSLRHPEGLTPLPKTPVFGQILVTCFGIALQKTASTKNAAVGSCFWSILSSLLLCVEAPASLSLRNRNPPSPARPSSRLPDHRRNQHEFENTWHPLLSRRRVCGELQTGADKTGGHTPRKCQEFEEWNLPPRR
jgi:hypothetical protein